MIHRHLDVPPDTPVEELPLAEPPADPVSRAEPDWRIQEGGTPAGP